MQQQLYQNQLRLQHTTQQLEHQIQMQQQQFLLQERNLAQQQQIIQQRELILKQQQQLLERNQSILSSSAEKENRGTKRKSSIGDDRAKRKSGRKKAEDKAHHDSMLREIVVAFINDRGAHKSVNAYCVEKKLDDLRHSVLRILGRTSELSDMKLAANRKNKSLVDHALWSLDLQIPPRVRAPLAAIDENAAGPASNNAPTDAPSEAPPGAPMDEEPSFSNAPTDAPLDALSEESSCNVPPPDAPPDAPPIEEPLSNDASPSEEAVDFFNLDTAKRLARRLDFSATRRMARDGSSEIRLHNKSHPDEVVKYQIFDLAAQI